MRFSTSTTSSSTTTASIPMITTIHQVTPNMLNIKKVFTNFVSKLPHHQKVGPSTTTSTIVVKNNSNSYIKAVPKKSISTAVKKDNDMNRDIRNYYTQQQSRKRQLEDVYNKKVELEREIRHKTVKQYQQQPQQKQRESCHHHYKELSTTTINNNKSAQQPKWINTHGYIRDVRTNSDYLRKSAISNSCKIATKEKTYLKKRSDEFIWGRKSPLQNSITM